MAAQKYVDEKLQMNKKVLMFSKPTCPFCLKAKKVFEEMIAEGKITRDDYAVFEISSESICEAIQSHLQTLTGARTVPRVFINGKCIGGGSEAESMYRSGELSKMLL